MPYQKIDIPPGINKKTTSYSVAPSWYDMNNMRFREGIAESIGGWERDQGTDSDPYYFQGFGRACLSSKAFDGYRYRFVGTAWKFYIVAGNKAVDITPNRVTGTLTNPFTRVSGSSLLRVAHNSHGLSVNDWVVFSSVGSDDSDSNFTQAVLQQSASGKSKQYGFQVVKVVDGNNYDVRIRDYSSSTFPAPVITAASNSSSAYGGSVTYYYKVSSGINNKVFGDGWGVGNWDGVSPAREWNTAAASTTTTTVDDVRRVYIDNYGEDLMFSNSGGPIYYYDLSANTSSGIPTRGILNVGKKLSDYTGSLDSPEVVDSFLISKKDGHCVALGCSDNDGSDTYNSMLVRWSDQNNPFDWRPTPTNTSGGQVLRVGSKIMGGISTKDEVLIFTDAGVYSMRFIGPPLTYSFNLVSSGVEIISSKASVNASGSVFFMGNDGFYSYNGNIRPLSSTVSKYVFDDFNYEQRDKCFASANSGFSEVYWFYVSSDSFEVDKYVAYNYEEDSWSIGTFDMSSTNESSTSDDTFSRTSWLDRGVFENPSSTYTFAYTPGSPDATTVVDEYQFSSLMIHEKGRQSQGSEMNSYIESSYIPLGEGDEAMFCSRILPDMQTFDYDGSGAYGAFYFSLFGRDYPGDSMDEDSDTILSTFTNSDQNHYVFNYPYPSSHKNNSIRFRSRFMKLKVSSGYNWGWRLGSVRVDMQPDGKR